MNVVFFVLVVFFIVLELLERIFDLFEILIDSLLVVLIGGFFVNVIGLIFFYEVYYYYLMGSLCGYFYVKKGKLLYEKVFRVKGGDY